MLVVCCSWLLSLSVVPWAVALSRVSQCLSTLVWFSNGMDELSAFLSPRHCYPLVLLHLPASVGRFAPSSRIRVLTRFHTFSLVFTHSHLDAVPLGALRYVLVHPVSCVRWCSYCVSLGHICRLRFMYNTSCLGNIFIYDLKFPLNSTCVLYTMAYGSLY